MPSVIKVDQIQSDTGNVIISGSKLGVGVTQTAQALRVESTDNSGGFAVAFLRQNGSASGGNGLVVDVTNTPAQYIADFRIGNQSKVTIDSTGAIDLASGQIKFPATQNASSNANTLDDYEEGNSVAIWYAYSGSTFVDVRVASRNEQGGYTKIGNKVTYWARLQHDNSYNSAYAGYGLAISLPFPISSSKYGFDPTKGPRIGTSSLASSTAAYRDSWIYGVPGQSYGFFNVSSDSNPFLYSYWGTGGGQVSYVLIEYFTD